MVADSVEAVAAVTEGRLSPGLPYLRLGHGPALVMALGGAAEHATPAGFVSTAPFPPSTAGNSDINATVSLPHPCIAPIVFVFGAPNVGWFAATGG